MSDFCALPRRGADKLRQGVPQVNGAALQYVVASDAGFVMLIPEGQHGALDALDPVPWGDYVSAEVFDISIAVTIMSLGGWRRRVAIRSTTHGMPARQKPAIDRSANALRHALESTNR
jgi:hypothetical protein